MEKKWEVKIDEKGNETAEEVMKTEVDKTDLITEIEDERTDLEKKFSIIKENERRRINLLFKKEIENQEKAIVETIVTDIELLKYSLTEAVSTFPEYKTSIEELYEQRTGSTGTQKKEE